MFPSEDAPEIADGNAVAQRQINLMSGFEILWPNVSNLPNHQDNCAYRAQVQLVSDVS
jgi:hypothetical protein